MKLVLEGLKLRPMHDYEAMDPDDIDDYEYRMYREEAFRELLEDQKVRDKANVAVVVYFKDREPVVMAKMNFARGQCDCCGDYDLFDNEITHVDIYEYPR